MKQIRGTSRYAFRSGEWAELVGNVNAKLTASYGGGKNRDLYIIRFFDGVCDLWPTIDPGADYEFREVDADGNVVIELPKWLTAAWNGESLRTYVLDRDGNVWWNTASGRWCTNDMLDEERHMTETVAYSARELFEKYAPLTLMVPGETVKKRVEE